MNNGMTIVVATVGQGAMVSRDSGESWERRQPHSEAMVRSLLTIPSKPGVVFGATDRGLYKSENSGYDWTPVESPLSRYAVWSLAADPQNPDVLFAGTGTPTPATSFKSTDGGQSWEERKVPMAESCPAVGTPRILQIAVDPGNSANLWMSVEVDGFRYSRDGGDSWQRLEGATNNPDGHSVLVTSGPPKSVFIVVNNEVFRSTDDGATWAPIHVKETFPWGHTRMIAAQPSKPETLFVAIGDATPGRTGTIMRSRDTGQTWQRLSLGTEPNSAMWRVAMEPENPDVVFAASRFGYLYRSDDGGDSWRKLWREFSEIADIAWLPN